LESLLENAHFKRRKLITLIIKEKKMKRFLLIFLSLGLIMAFSASAFAVDVKLSADFEVGGLYLNKTNVSDNNSSYYYIDGQRLNHHGVLVPSFAKNAVGADASTAFFYQRLRIGADFVVSPCLKLVTSVDALDRIWGGARSAAGNTANGSDPVMGSNITAGTRAESENIAMRLAYVEYTSPIGLFRVGYQPDYDWGTVFAGRRSGTPVGQITYVVPVGPVAIIGQYAKEVDNSASAVTNSTTTDNDYDSYRIGAIYNFKGGEAGALFAWNRNATDKASYSAMTRDGITSPAPPYLQNAYSVLPYFKATIGPVFVQGEIQYTFGDGAKWEGPNTLNLSDVNINALSVFLDATANFGMFYVGGSFAYLEGDDPNPTSNTIKGGIGVNSGGLDWNPCLILFNTQTTAYWVGGLTGNDGALLDNEMQNAWFFQGRVGVKPTPKWDIQLAVAYATADQKPQGYANGTYGTEVDVTATYKITNNLSYMLGGAYLFTGDFFQGSTTGYRYPWITGQETVNTQVQNDYMLINKLTLSF
jgi:hypothetical protein